MAGKDGLAAAPLPLRIGLAEGYTRSVMVLLAV